MTRRNGDVIATLSRVRLATGAQLERLHFADVTRRQTRAVLASLVDRRLLGRLPRLIGGVRAGSAGYVYALDVAGQRLAAPGGRRPLRPWAVGTAFLAHTLAVTELYVRLIEAERGGRVRLESFTTEPACWRAFAGPAGARLVLKPDAAITIQLNRFEDRWFIEVDRATESLPTIGRKCEAYRRYWASGREQATSGVFPRVLWLAPDQPRCQQLLGVILRQPRDAQALFTVAVFDQAVERIGRGAQP